MKAPKILKVVKKATPSKSFHKFSDYESSDYSKRYCTTK